MSWQLRNVVVLLFLGAQLSWACKELWFNQCTGNSDCCSNFCDKLDSWRHGVCKEIRTTCRPLFDNECKKDADCCSLYCDKGPSGDWAFGVCKTPDDPTVCKELNYNRCRKDADCCSNNCYKGPNGGWKDGVCKEEKVPEKVPEKPTATATVNSDQPAAVFGGKCHELWFNGCTSSADCCSGFCFLGDQNNWAVGVCKPGEGRVQVPIEKEADTPKCTQSLHELCTDTWQCCRGICAIEEDQNMGVCQI